MDDRRGGMYGEESVRGRGLAGRREK